MELDLAKQKEQFLDLCKTKINRDGLDALLNWLTDEKKSDFCSSRCFFDRRKSSYGKRKDRQAAGS